MDHHRWCVASFNLREDDWGVEDHEKALSVLEWSGVYDQLDIGNIVAPERLLGNAQPYEHH